MRIRGIHVLSLVLLTASSAWTQDVVFERRDFASWDYPRGLVNVEAEGVTVKRFGGSYNAVANAGQFRSTSIAYHGRLPEHTPSNPATAHFATDQDPTTWWQPDPGDPVESWWIEIDLGRAVVAERIRLIFPDAAHARPLGSFQVWTSPGIPVFGALTPRIVFDRVGRPVHGNEDRVVELELFTAGLNPAVGENMDNGDSLGFDIIRFVRIEALGRNAGAALAEVEVDAVGYNLATRVMTQQRVEEGVTHWGGRTWTSKDRDCDRACAKGSGAEELIDQDLGYRWWAIESGSAMNWRDTGIWSVIDFGNVFRVDRIVWLPIVQGASQIIYGFERDRQCPWWKFEFLTSDGTPSQSADADVEGPYLYERLSLVDNERYAPQRRSLFDFRFEPRDTRLVLWRVLENAGLCRALQTFVFHAEGYPRQVEMQSADIPLGSATSIERVEWDADVPPGSRIEIATMTGDGYRTVTRYYLTNGVEVTRTAYESAKSRNRGDVVEETVRDLTWSDWSRPHRASGQSFLSPTPRNFLRARVRLISDEPQAMPVLHSLRFVARPPLVASGLRGAIHPRSAALDSLQAFRYTVQPVDGSQGDLGFDEVRLDFPETCQGLELLDVTIGGDAVEPSSETGEGRLVVRLPRRVVRDSVAISFAARLLTSPTVFGAAVANAANPSNTQGVIPAVSGADRVFVPGAVAGDQLVRSLTMSAAFSPNGDGINDRFELRYVLVKTERMPRVTLHALDGRKIVELQGSGLATGRLEHSWDGFSEGRRVPPGVYLMRIRVDADSGAQEIVRPFQVVY